MTDPTPEKTLRVECYSGHRADEYPQRFTLGGREVAVEEILDRWLDPAYRYFKLRGSDEGIYILRHDQASDSWELILYDSGKRDDTRLSST
jgi:hypothetical protein